MLRDKKCSTLLVVLEQHFIINGSEVYTDVQCDKLFWDRYLAVFDRLIVCARMRPAIPEDKLSGLLQSNRPEVEFVAMPDFTGAFGLVNHQIAIRQVIKKCLSRSDAAICRLPSPISLVACPIFDKSCVPWAGEMMMNPRTAYSRESMQHLLQPVIQAMAVRSTKKACLSANGISYVTDRVLQKEYPCRAIVDPHAEGFFTSNYSTINLDKNSYSILDWGDEPPQRVVLAHSGKMSDNRKGHTVFIETVSLLRKMGVNVYGILIGDGPKRPEFEALAVSLGIGEYCEFTGWVCGFDEVQKLLHSAQFFIFPTLSEGLPRAIIEAMASGLICLANAVDGIPELLETECLSTSNTPDSYANMVSNFLRDWRHGRDVRKRQFDCAFRFRSEVLTDRRTHFYQRLLDSAMSSSI